MRSIESFANTKWEEYESRPLSALARLNGMSEDQAKFIQILGNQHGVKRNEMDGDSARYDPRGFLKVRQWLEDQKVDVTRVDRAPRVTLEEFQTKTGISDAKMRELRYTFDLDETGAPEWADPDTYNEAVLLAAAGQEKQMAQSAEAILKLYELDSIPEYVNPFAVKNVTRAYDDAATLTGTLASKPRLTMHGPGQYTADFDMEVDAGAGKKPQTIKNLRVDPMQASDLAEAAVGMDMSVKLHMCRARLDIDPGKVVMFTDAAAVEVPAVDRMRLDRSRQVQFASQGPSW